MNLDQLSRLAPTTAIPTLRNFLDPLNAAMVRFPIDTPKRQAHFIAQVVHETRGFEKMTENLNYKVQALLTQWPRHFTPELAALYGRVDGGQGANQTMIANVAYADRMGNGSIESGDGWRYRGRGPMMLTGKENYEKCGAALGVDLVRYPEQVALPELGCLAAAWFWKRARMNELADAGNVDKISSIVNGGNVGRPERVRLTGLALRILNEPTKAVA